MNYRANPPASRQDQQVRELREALAQALDAAEDARAREANLLERLSGMYWYMHNPSECPDNEGDCTCGLVAHNANLDDALREDGDEYNHVAFWQKYVVVQAMKTHLANRTGCLNYLLQEQYRSKRQDPDFIRYWWKRYVMTEDQIAQLWVFKERFLPAEMEPERITWGTLISLIAPDQATSLQMDDIVRSHYSGGGLPF